MLADTSILIRLWQTQHALYSLTDQAIECLLEQGRDLRIVPQNLVEFWVVATRPVAQNGLGLTPAHASDELNRIKDMFELLPETSTIYQVWEPLSGSTQYQASQHTMPDL